MEMKDEEDSSVLEPPHHDMVHLQFRGDDFSMSIPYCEVANGTLVQVTDTHVHVCGIGADVVEVSKQEFKSLLEKTFDHKEIIKLAVQLEQTFDTIVIL